MKSLWTICLIAVTAIAVPSSSQANTAGSSSFLSFEVLQFYAYSYTEGAVIVWKIQNDANVETYYLQHSMNQLEWTTIDEFQALPDEEINSNDYYHADLTDGLHYYRLLIRMQDGTEVISKVIVNRINLDSIDSEGLPFGPTGVVVGNAQPDSPDQGEVQVVNARGDIIIQRPSDIGLEYEIQALPSGLYYVRYTRSGLIHKINRL